MTAQPDPVVARPATAGDLEAVTQLASLARSESHDERGGYLLFDLTHASVADHARYETAHAGAESTVVIGGVQGEIVGYATARIVRGAAETVCLIDELFVHPQARSVGVGQALLEQIQAWARDHECSYVESQVLPGNRAAKNFFERVGMVTRAMRVSAALDPEI